MAAESGALEEALHAAAGPPDPAGGEAATRIRLALLRLRRDVHNARPPSDEDRAHAAHARSAGGAAGFMDPLARYASSLDRLIDLRRKYREAFDADLRGARAALSGIVRDGLFAEGVALASRSLARQLRALAERDPDGWNHGERLAASKAAAYLARFATKTSPNALFCATATALAQGERTSVEGSPGIARIDALLNIYEASKVVACLASSREAEPAIVPRPNPTLREEGEGLTFWKPASPRNPGDEEILSRVKEHPVMRAFLETAARDALPAARLIDAVAERFGLGSAEIEPFYRGLVDRGILIAEVEIPYNEPRPLRTLAGACRAAGCEASWIPELESMEDLVDRIPALEPRERDRVMADIGASLERLPHVRPLKQDEFFRVDAASSLHVILPLRVLDEIRRPLRSYVRLFSAIYPAPMYERSLASRFLEKYPADRDIPFLDLYHGLLEPQAIERPAAFPDPSGLARPGTGVEEAAAVMRRVRDHFASRARATPRGGEILLEEDEVRALTADAPEPRWSAGVLFQIAAREIRDIDAGRYRLVLGALFPGVGLALARFHRLHGGGDPEAVQPIVRELRRGWSSLERPGAVVAEITYNHRARTANAGLRPTLFRHEIELPGEKATQGADVIPLSELRVRLDRSAGRFVLTWSRRDVEVVPVITSGVNPTGIISFLVAIGQQGFQPLGYFPGFETEGILRWPRIVSGNMVLFRERWVFPPDEWPESATATRRSPGAGSGARDAEFFLEIGRWRRRHGLPRHVFAHTTREPKPRYLDLESPLFAEHLMRIIEGLHASAEPAPSQGPGLPAAAPHALTITEMLPGPEDLWIAHAGGYASEFLVQLEGP